MATDDPVNAAQLAEVARRSGRPLTVLVDVKVGGRRTGLADETQAVALAYLIAGSDGLEFGGLQGYVGDHQNTADYDRRRARSRELLQPLARLADRLHAGGLAPRVV